MLLLLRQRRLRLWPPRPGRKALQLPGTGRKALLWPSAGGKGLLLLLLLPHPGRDEAASDVVLRL